MIDGKCEREKCHSKILLMPQFPHADRSYKCLCGLIHVKVATRAIGAITMLFIFITLIWVILISSDKRYGLLGSMILYSIPALIVIIAIIALFLGVVQKKCKFLLPFIFIQIMTILISTVFLIMVIIFVMSNMWHMIRSSFREILIDPENQGQAKALVICILIIHILFSMWSTHVFTNELMYNNINLTRIRVNTSEISRLRDTSDVPEQIGHAGFGFKQISDSNLHLQNK